MFLLLFVFCYGLNNSYASIAPFIKSCKLTENDCFLATNLQIAIPYLADGISELEIPAGEPLSFENIVSEQGNFKLILPHLDVYGAKKCRISHFKQNHEESTLKLTIDCPMLATGKYRYVGKIFFFDIDKEGDFKIETDKMRTEMTIKVDKVVVDGKKYWDLLSYEYTYDVLESMHVELKDLFKGDIGKALPYFIGAEDKLNTALQVGDPIAKNIVKEFFDILKTFFLSVPISQLEKH